MIHFRKPMSGRIAAPYDVGMNLDPTTSNPDLYKVIFENDRVRVLEYKDRPGEATTPHVHPDSVMYTLSSFNRRLASGGREVDVEIQAGSARWLDAQEHSGLNIGDSDTHVIFVELKEPKPTNSSDLAAAPLGPSAT
jgi:beta-alanine degradation protein BauB